MDSEHSLSPAAGEGQPAGNAAEPALWGGKQLNMFTVTSFKATYLHQLSKSM